MSAAIDESLRPVLCACNPFEDVARPQQSDGRFPRVHVRSVLREPRQRLLAAIDAYRVQHYGSLLDLPPSRVVKILGDRGAGKTHLYEAILNRDDGRHQLLISRETENFDEGMPFEEYLFQLLMTALNAHHPPHGYRYFDAMAAQLARKLLLHTLQDLGPTDRLFVVSPTRWQQFCLLWRGGEAIAQRFEDLAAELQHPGNPADLRQLCLRAQLDPDRLAGLTLARLARLEPGEETPSIIRRELYGAMIRAALLGDRGALYGFLEADYQPASRGRALHRADIVRHLLHAVGEACALVQLPVVYAFDNLEGLLAPAGNFLPRRAAAFLEGLAQAVDHTRGFLFLVFFEQGLFQQALMHAGTFARSRLDLGVPVPGRSRVAEMELQPPNPDELCALVQGRMAMLREQLPDGSALPAHFPFSSRFIEDLGTLRGQPIRGKLEALREEYNRLVFGGPGPSVPPPPLLPLPAPKPMTGEELERAWEEALVEAGRTLDLPWADRHADLTRALSELLQAGLPWPERYPHLTPEVDALTIGDNPRHGHATLLKFDGAPTRVAVGFLLAPGNGMPLDLRAKFAAFSDDKVQADLLIVLWPTSKVAADLPSVLPKKTGEVWQEEREQHRAWLRAVELTTLRKILAFRCLPEKIGLQEASLPRETLRSFVQQRCAEVYPLVIPPREEH